MSQSYFPTYRPLQPLPDSLDELAASPSTKHEDEVPDIDIKGDDVQAYQEQRDRLAKGIDATAQLLADLRDFNKTSWVFRYPHIAPSAAAEKSRPGNHRRALSFADDPSATTEVMFTPKKKGGLLKRSLTMAAFKAEQAVKAEASSSQETAEPAEDDALVSPSTASDFHVLRLDLKLGPHGSSTSAGALVSQLEKASIASLLSERIGSTLGHLTKLRARVEDTSSKVLVTGDLNAGKSTFVNALLRREVMPVDQQPCTTMFCEVHDAADNGGVEEAHVVREGCTYAMGDETTYERHALAELESIVTDSDAQRILKLYVSDPRSPASSLLSNGTVNISLIDAPGLNRDSLKTTALFARQEEIDVVVFVVSAENHFTLSAKEFLWNASNEKAYLFIVVNRFDAIRDKARCRRLVLEQIRQLSPRTFDDADDLVHFVDSASVMAKPDAPPEAFSALETSLRSFVLTKRAKSKLQPASTYLTKVLSDLDLLTSANAVVAQAEMKQAQEDLARARPVLEKMLAGREGLDDALESTEDGMSSEAGEKARQTLERALDAVGRGESTLLPAFSGLLNLWQYTRDVKKALLRTLDAAVKAAEDEARGLAVNGVGKVGQLGDAHLPLGVERSRRVFVPEAMFAVRPSNKRRSTYELGLGLAARPDMADVELRDIVDLRHYLARLALFGQSPDDSSNKKASAEEETDVTASALSVLSLGVGAVTMVGGKALGARGLLEGLVRLGDLFGSPASRRWAAPAAGALALGLTLYFVLELPRTVPRTVGRHVRAAAVQQDFASAHSARVARETRKVMRLAAWDLRERFRAAVDERATEVRNWEEVERVAMRAVEWFEEAGRRAEGVREEAGLVGGVEEVGVRN